MGQKRASARWDLPQNGQVSVCSIMSPLNPIESGVMDKVLPEPASNPAHRLRPSIWFGTLVQHPHEYFAMAFPKGQFITPYPKRFLCSLGRRENHGKLSLIHI